MTNYGQSYNLTMAKSALDLEAIIDEFNCTGLRVVCEDYRVYRSKQRQHTHSNLFTPRLLGSIETHCERLNIKPVKYMASVVKTFCTDDKLSEWGFWVPGQRHARDAIRHATYSLLFYKPPKRM